MILFIAAMPPPVHGQSVVNSFLLNYLGPRVEGLIGLDVSPKVGKGLFVYHWSRILAYSIAIGRMVSARKQISAVYSVYEAGFGFAYTLMVAAVARVLNVRVILHHHTSQHSKRFSLKFDLLVRVLGQKTVHVVLSSAMGRDLLHLYGVEGLVLPNAAVVGMQPFRGASDAPEQRLRLGMLANLNEEKGLFDAIEALAQLRRVSPSAQLILAGPIANPLDRERVVALCRSDLGLSWVGPVYGEEKDDFLCSIDLFIFPSKYRFEAQPLVVLEALARGVPVVVRDVGYCAELGLELNSVCPEGGDFGVFLIDWLSKNVVPSDTVRLLAIRAFERQLELSQIGLTSFVEMVRQKRA